MGTLQKFGIEILACVWVLLWTVCAFDGHYGYDDMEYAKIAHSILSGSFSLSEPFSYRLGLTVPMALFFAIGGMEDHTALAFNFFCSALLIFLVADSTTNHKQKLWAVFLLVTCYYWLWYGAKIYPDSAVALCHFGMIWTIYKHKKLGGFRAAGLFVLFFFWGFMSKETIVFAVPFVCICFFKALLDALEQQKTPEWRGLLFWIYSLILGSLLFGGFFYVCYHLKGSFFHRFELIAQNHYFNPCSYDQMPASVTLNRISAGLSGGLFGWGMALVLIFSFFSSNKFWNYALLSALLSFNFLTTSWNSYLPICLEGRHFLALVPLGAVVSSKGIQYVFSKNRIDFKLIFWASAVLLGAWVWGGKISWLYGGIVLAVGIKMIKPKISVLLLVACFLAHPIYVMFKPSETYYSEQKSILRNKEPKADFIVSDEMSARMGEYILGYRMPFFSYDSALRSDLRHKNILILSNPYNAAYLKTYAPNLKTYEEFLDHHKIQPSVFARTKHIILWRLEAK